MEMDLRKRTIRDRHHVLFSHKHWGSSKDALALRGDSSLIVKLDQDIHRELHRNCPPVPILGETALRITFRDYERGDTPLESVENFQRAIESAIHHHRAHPLESKLGELCVETLEIQKPYIMTSPRMAKSKAV